jgi:hypothetical protein
MRQTPEFGYTSPKGVSSVMKRAEGEQKAMPHCALIIFKCHPANVLEPRGTESNIQKDNDAKRFTNLHATLERTASTGSKSGPRASMGCGQL